MVPVGRVEPPVPVLPADDDVEVLDETDVVDEAFVEVEVLVVAAEELPGKH